MDSLRRLFTSRNNDRETLHRHRGEPDSVDSLNDLLAGLQQLDLTNNLKIGRMKASGGFADVYEGLLRLKDKKEAKKVAVKRFRVFVDGNRDFAKVA